MMISHSIVYNHIIVDYIYVNKIEEKYQMSEQPEFRHLLFSYNFPIIQGNITIHNYLILKYTKELF